MQLYAFKKNCFKITIVDVNSNKIHDMIYFSPPWPFCCLLLAVCVLEELMSPCVNHKHREQRGERQDSAIKEHTIKSPQILTNLEPVLIQSRVLGNIPKSFSEWF